MTTSSSIELDEKLSQLQHNFFIVLNKITEQRLKHEKSASSSKIDSSTTDDIFCKVQDVKPPAPKPLTVRLESSLGEKLAKSRGTAYELEDKLHETRVAFEDKLQIVERIKRELDRRENLLIQSIQQIETYLRAIFYLKQEADDMYVQLMNSSKVQERTLDELRKDLDIFKGRKNSVIKAISAFNSAKLSLENIVSDLPKYSSSKDLIEYHLVLKELQKDLLRQEAEWTDEQERLESERLQTVEYKRRVPLLVASKERAILKLNSKLVNLKSETAQLEEQVDIAISTKAEDDVSMYDTQRWIKKIFDTCAEIKSPALEEPTAGTLNMLDRIKDFVADALEMVERLKTRTTA